MHSRDFPIEDFSRLESAVAFRLFADHPGLTLTVPEQIAATLGERILDGALAPGARIGEQEIADEFGVSRGPIREALRILEREGLVTILACRGAVVTELSAHELAELMDVRAGLFEVVIRKLMAREVPGFLPLMRAGTARLAALAESDAHGDAYAETTYRLLILITRLTGNERLQRMLTSLSLQTLRYSKLGLRSLERRRRSATLWSQALDAVERRDVQAAIDLMHRRIEESATEASRLMQAHPPGDAP